MRTALLSDVHANLEALDAVLEFLAGERPDATYVLGDLVGYGADPGAVLRRLRSIDGVELLAGNHDLAATGRFDSSWFNPVAREAIGWTAGVLDDEERALLARLEPRRTLPAGVCVHGSVIDPVAEYVVGTDDARASFAADPFGRCFFGHTHLPTVFIMDPAGVVSGAPLHDGQVLTLDPTMRTMLNPGSVGQPRDGDPRACCLVVDDEAGTATMHRVPYDVPGAQAKIRSAGLPEPLAARLGAGR